MKSQWSSSNGTPLPGARRNGRYWNEAEEYDLKHAWRLGRSVAWLAREHERLENAIELRLCKLYGVDFLTEIDLKKAPFERTQSADRTKKPEFVWASSDGRVLRVKDMTLDHLLNAVNDAHFRVAKMRALGMRALGEGNINITDVTRNAFVNVGPRDVFTAWPQLVRETRTKFHNQFGLALADVRNVVYHAWETGERVKAEYRDAVTFYLRINRTSLGVPTRFDDYVSVFRPTTAAEFRTMCWNLRMDQPMATNRFSPRFGAAVVFSNHSALKFEEPKIVRTNTDFGMFDEDWMEFR